MSTQVQFRRGTTSDHSSFTGAVGEVTVDTTKDRIVVHDGTKVGGYPTDPSFEEHKKYDSGVQTITLGTTLTLAHGLGAIPRLVIAVLQCATAEYGYAVGDEISLSASAMSNDTNYGINTSADSTNLYVTIGSGGIQILRKDSGSIGLSALITVANWKLVLRAWA